MRSVISDQKAMETLVTGSRNDARTIRSTTSKPPASPFSLERYKQYLRLLAQADGVGASRSASARGATVCVLVWAAGRAGDAQHASICWVPGGQGSDAGTRRHIEQDWYLEKDD